MIMPSGRDDAARRGMFASMVAHELRTPLTAAFGALEMMSRAAPASSDDAARQAALIGLAHRNTQRLLRIVEDCLDLEAASDGRLTLAATCVDPGELVALGVDGACSAREQTGIDVLLQLDAGRTLMGDRERLGRAVAHLVQNAVTFAPPGTVVTVTTTDVPEREAVRFTVEDRGAGLDPQQMKALFQRFDVRDAPGRRRIGGLGMGLAFVRTIAELHGGVVAARSEPGYTKIGFEVPCG
jgi:signal transduction histidine kinase